MRLAWLGADQFLALLRQKARLQGQAGMSEQELAAAIRRELEVG
jgi:hypothetical protein